MSDHGERLKSVPLMVALAEPVSDDAHYDPKLGAMTKYKTFTGETIGAEKVWNYDYHNDDD